MTFTPSSSSSTAWGRWEGEANLHGSSPLQMDQPGRDHLQVSLPREPDSFVSETGAAVSPPTAG